MTLRKVVVAVTVGVDNNGNKLEVVDVMASSSSEIAKINSTGVDDVLFDSFRTEKSEKNATADMVDMADFEAIANYPELQPAILGHFLSERAASKNYEEGHKQGLVIELEVIQEKYKNAVVRNKESLEKYMNRPLDNMGFEGKLTGYAFDYGEVMFLFIVGDHKVNDNKEIFNPHKVYGAIEVK